MSEFRIEAESILEMLLDNGEHQLKPGTDREKLIDAMADVLYDAWNEARDIADDAIDTKGE